MRQFLEIMEAKKSSMEVYKEKHGIKGMGVGLGFSEKEKKWYGWSHRATYGFGVGHEVKKGHLPAKYRGQTAKTLDDAKKFAVAFADEVS